MRTSPEWDLDEVKYLLRLKVSGFANTAISALLGRSVAAVRSRLWELLHVGLPAERCGYRGVSFTRRKQVKHGMSHHPLYDVFCQMYYRCINPKHRKYQDYGGRGIKLADAFNPDKVGMEEALRNYIRECERVGWYEGCGLTIDRKNNEGDYAPGNLRLATFSVQSNNRRPFTRSSKSEVIRRAQEVLDGLGGNSATAGGGVAAVPA